MRVLLGSSLGLALLVMAVSACADDATQADPSTTVSPETTLPVATTDAASTTPDGTGLTTTSSAAADCPTVTFEELPAPWDPTIRDEQGGGSGLPGAHIERPGAFINLFPGGSIWTPSASASITVDGYPGQIGTVEDGLSVRVSLTGGPCDTFDFVAYGVGEDELRAVMTAVRFE